ncbi:uncharacterized protein LACBIDRAFT_332014 [Laccaria bicolor S238N-H82]|uniref:Predicted protein n=1 Tax=Laccaria bicolor (strain S238N-H82 / ATCC MYA-4686) TaxID=486041 RepID=B0DRA2_LACBS|nr:uncharacterized protein LACBIDRAFT_332014 [Laccaria bicolor S238N-H82]EDR02749.1 predicted protein [Laccaria bicolor S238N-H82]|eukprot:XP_001886459.1 predicted protein [Laccaria bicolor S238N-H82]
MKFYAYSLVLPIALFKQAFAAPIPRPLSICRLPTASYLWVVPNVISTALWYSSSFLSDPGPTGFRCCGPISVTLGGTSVIIRYGTKTIWSNSFAAAFPTARSVLCQ